MDQLLDESWLEFRAQCRTLDAVRGDYWMRRVERELGLHPNSIERYRSGQYRTPDDVRARVHAFYTSLVATAR